jgi:hypothetical protein
MNPRICRCCGEPIHELGNALSRNPNVCASCSSMADGMEELNLPVGDEPSEAQVGATASCEGSGELSGPVAQLVSPEI